MKLEMERAESPLKIPRRGNQPIKQFLEALITEEEVNKAIRKLAMRKAAGDDEITGEVIKQNEEWVKEIIYRIFKDMEEGGNE